MLGERVAQALQSVQGHLQPIQGGAGAAAVTNTICKCRLCREHQSHRTRQRLSTKGNLAPYAIAPAAAGLEQSASDLVACMQLLNVCTIGV